MTKVLQRCIWGREKLAEPGYEAGSLGEEQRRNSGFCGEAGVLGGCNGRPDGSRETGVRGSGEKKIDIMHLKRSTCVSIGVPRACV